LLASWDEPEYPKVEHARALGILDRWKRLDEVDLQQRWQNMVSEYSALALTKSSDRLSALEGYASQVGGVLKDSCYFGFWSRDLFQRPSLAT
jgi:hypothetical protein